MTKERSMVMEQKPLRRSSEPSINLIRISVISTSDPPSPHGISRRFRSASEYAGVYDTSICAGTCVVWVAVTSAPGSRLVCKLIAACSVSACEAEIAKQADPLPVN